MDVVFGPENFVDFQCGQTRPARFRHNSGLWLVRYPGDQQRNLRLVSEFVGCKLAILFEVPVPEFRLVRIREAFSPQGSETTISAGIGTATRWLSGASFPDVEQEPLDAFWAEETYLTIAAGARILDTWVMNYDRRKVGNIAVSGDVPPPRVYFLDFDQAFLAKCKKAGRRPHWISADFDRQMLEDSELLSGFDGAGTTRSASLQEPRHFRPSVERLRAIPVSAMKDLL